MVKKNPYRVHYFFLFLQNRTSIVATLSLFPFLCLIPLISLSSFFLQLHLMKPSPFSNHTLNLPYPPLISPPLHIYSLRILTGPPWKHFTALSCYPHSACFNHSFRNAYLNSFNIYYIVQSLRSNTVLTPYYCMWED